MSRVLGTKSLIPFFIGAVALGTGCTFEPPGSVLGPGGGGGGADGGPAGGADAEPAGGGETLSVTFTSEPVGIDATYAPANIVATWIEDSAGAFVATIDRQAAVRINHLVAWRAMSGVNDTDAVTGATRLNHATPVSLTWNIPAALPNGIYTIRMETADANAVTADENRQGTFTFDKNGTASTVTENALGYTNVNIVYSGAAAP